MNRTYTELSKLKTFEERYEYLKLEGNVGEDTFGFDRYINQKFYRSPEWKRVRDFVITRDSGCDLGIAGREILERKIIVHHMNPIKKDDIIYKSDYLLNPDYLICVSERTHNGIHYGNDYLYEEEVIERKPNDMCPWKS